MKHKGINYDVGTFTRGKESSSRDIFDIAEVEKDMHIIKNELNCTAIRISGEDINRLVKASELALKAGLEVWFSPALIDRDEKETLEYFSRCAKEAEELRKRFSSIIFVTGCELTFFMKGLVLGDTSFERINTFMNPWKLLKNTILKGSFHKRLNSFLTKAVKIVKENFNGEVTYASGSWENVNWELFDIIGIDHYKDKMNKNTYRDKLRSYFKYNKPVVITEFGCCTYKGAEEKGGYGWNIVDKTKFPYEVKGDFIRDENIQADYILESLKIFEEEEVKGVFVFTFVSQSYPYNENPKYDLDMGAYGIVKTIINSDGEAFWEPKKAYHVLAEYYEKY